MHKSSNFSLSYFNSDMTGVKPEEKHTYQQCHMQSGLFQIEDKLFQQPVIPISWVKIQGVSSDLWSDILSVL